MNNWYINRLKTMSFPEILFRGSQFLQKLLEKHLWRKINHVNKIQTPFLQIIKKEKLKKNEFILDNTYSIFGKDFKFSNYKEINWHLDIFTGKTFPLKFSKDMNILSDPQLSAKVVWEINRQQFLMKVVLNYENTKNPVYLNHFISILQDWINKNPYLSGINWYSNIEVNIRLINWFLFWEILEIEKLMENSPVIKAFVNDYWIPSIYEHCHYSYKNPSYYSSANNHLISEYAGLFVAATKWKFKESKKWVKFSKNGLEEEIKKQHSNKGINKEEAAEYIQFITDFFLISYVVGEKSGNSFSQNFKNNLEKILNYIYNFLDINSNFPKYGDEDDGWCFRLDFESGFNNFQSLLTSGAILFKNPKFKSKSNGGDIKNELLFGKESLKVFESLNSIKEVESSKFYTEEGHFYFKKQEDDKEIYLHFDAAPLGFLSIAAHGHADALSILLHVDGDPILIDPGTFTYHTEKKWRNYFLSTLAHNTICIDGENQAVQGGPTLWIKHFKTNVVMVEKGKDQERVSASHNGYKRLSCSHQREVIFERTMNRFVINDQIGCHKNGKSIIQSWHLHPDVEVKNIDSHAFLLKNKHGKRNLKIQLDKRLNIDIINGQEAPLLGWYSESFMKKEKTNVIIGKREVSETLNLNLKTQIEII